MPPKHRYRPEQAASAAYQRQLQERRAPRGAAATQPPPHGEAPRGEAPRGGRQCEWCGGPFTAAHIMDCERAVPPPTGRIRLELAASALRTPEARAAIPEPLPLRGRPPAGAPPSRPAHAGADPWP